MSQTATVGQSNPQTVTSPPTDRAAAASLVSEATRSGAVDTASLAASVREAHSADPAKARVAHDAIVSELRAISPAVAGRYEREVVSAFRDTPPIAGVTIAAGSATSEAGRAVLRDNPILSVEWTSTTNLNGKAGFTPGLADLLAENGIDVDATARPRPAAVTSNAPAHRTANGAAARDAVATDYRSRGYTTQTEVPFQTRVSTPQTPTGVRRVDVVADMPGPTPETGSRVLVESKLGRTGLDGFVRSEVAKDADLLAQNTRVRTLGKAADIGGRILRPVGTAVDAWSIREAVRQDGGRFGENAQRTTSGVVGGAVGGAGGAWAGAAAGAAIGSVVPIVGTAAGAVVGGLIGGFFGGWGGDAAGRAAYDAASSN